MRSTSGAAAGIHIRKCGCSYTRMIARHTAVWQHMVGVVTARQESWGRCFAPMANRRNSRNNPRTVGVTQTRGMSGAPAAA
eukprot:351300-Chlamydomonas_euryale.AAC.2